ncbi:hypothetical protein N656DRAFT_189068 [Canariomyces notabilis]|uniref:Uncharacterized protein n=1 Tax=Canariomyces notabilis TaxID=2074819 RepID=A0AAN6QIQ6_9PEZI|nr:hypothetical protein N656DRAFT_189068 [Canariomyces arenarius]
MAVDERLFAQAMELTQVLKAHHVLPPDRRRRPRENDGGTRIAAQCRPPSQANFAYLDQVRGHIERGRMSVGSMVACRQDVSTLRDVDIGLILLHKVLDFSWRRAAASLPPCCQSTYPSKSRTALHRASPSAADTVASSLKQCPRWRPALSAAWRT